MKTTCLKNGPTSSTTANKGKGEKGVSEGQVPVSH
jgi:hypothetical protein